MNNSPSQTTIFAEINILRTALPDDDELNIPFVLKGSIYDIAHIKLHLHAHTYIHTYVHMNTLALFVNTHTS